MVRKDFRIVSLFALTTLMAILCGGWIAWQRYTTRHVRLHEQLLRGGLLYDYEGNLNSLDAPSVTAKSTWIDLERVSFTTDAMGHVSQIRDLRSLDLSCASITDNDLRHIANLDQLEYLELRNTQISDQGLSHLLGLASLETLVLDHTKVTDQGVQQLLKLPRLKSLSLSFTSVTDAACKTLDGHPHLERVHVYGTEVTRQQGKQYQVCGPRPSELFVTPTVAAIAGDWSATEQGGIRELTFQDMLERASQFAYCGPSETATCHVALPHAGPNYPYSLAPEQSIVVLHDHEGHVIGGAYLLKNGHLLVQVAVSQYEYHTQYLVRKRQLNPHSN